MLRGGPLPAAAAVCVASPSESSPLEAALEQLPDLQDSGEGASGIPVLSGAPTANFSPPCGRLFRVFFPVSLLKASRGWIIGWGLTDGTAVACAVLPEMPPPLVAFFLKQLNERLHVELIGWCRGADCDASCPYEEAAVLKQVLHFIEKQQKQQKGCFLEQRRGVWLDVWLDESTGLPVPLRVLSQVDAESIVGTGVPSPASDIRLRSSPTEADAAAGKGSSPPTAAQTASATATAARLASGGGKPPSRCGVFLYDMPSWVTCGTLAAAPHDAAQASAAAAFVQKPTAARALLRQTAQGVGALTEEQMQKMPSGESVCGFEAALSLMNVSAAVHYSTDQQLQCWRELQLEQQAARAAPPGAPRVTDSSRGVGVSSRSKSSGLYQRAQQQKPRQGVSCPPLRRKYLPRELSVSALWLYGGVFVVLMDLLLGLFLPQLLAVLAYSVFPTDACSPFSPALPRAPHFQQTDHSPLFPVSLGYAAAPVLYPEPLLTPHSEEELPAEETQRDPLQPPSPAAPPVSYHTTGKLPEIAISLQARDSETTRKNRRERLGCPHASAATGSATEGEGDVEVSSRLPSSFRELMLQPTSSVLVNLFSTCYCFLHLHLLTAHVHWLMDFPAGLKLNTNLTRVLGSVILTAINIWNDATSYLHSAIRTAEQLKWGFFEKQETASECADQRGVLSGLMILESLKRAAVNGLSALHKLLRRNPDTAQALNSEAPSTTMTPAQGTAERLAVSATPTANSSIANSNSHSHSDTASFEDPASYAQRAWGVCRLWLKAGLGTLLTTFRLGWLGLSASMFAAASADLLMLVTLHIFYVYLVCARLFHVNLKSLHSLFLLFRWVLCVTQEKAFSLFSPVDGDVCERGLDGLFRLFILPREKRENGPLNRFPSLMGFLVRARMRFLRDFEGQKWNVLRRRVDSANLQVDQLLIGCILFTIAVCLFPTTLLFYISYLLIWLLIFSTQSLLRLALLLFMSFPSCLILFRAVAPHLLSAGVSIEPLTRLPPETPLRRTSTSRLHSFFCSLAAAHRGSEVTPAATAGAGGPTAASRSNHIYFMVRARPISYGEIIWPSISAAAKASLAPLRPSALFPKIINGDIVRLSRYNCAAAPPSSPSAYSIGRRQGEATGGRAAT
ncbi:N-acetylglucosaminyl transferase component domain-containing protein [Cyclospora cayetanensis]|uniref:N-acetylglucosaminyl transferase component domain-containing protein n=1 Tax=Cyclospora cayetanensis TaxID=88456 RepID=A0A1D3D9J2_9EIME|nr:N-acetylglucosaminyl transferase component domain-containing protein [Cyclospora cayetanensis]